jgi:hypothetical protein
MSYGSTYGVVHGIQNIVHIRSSVKLEKVEWQLRETVGNRFQLVGHASVTHWERLASELLHQLVHQSSILDFKATPEDIYGLLGQVQRHLA